MTQLLRFYANSKIVTELGDQHCVRHIGFGRTALATHTTTDSRKSCTLPATDPSGTTSREINGPSTTTHTYSPYGYRAQLISNSLAFNGERLETPGFYMLGNGYRIFSPCLMRFMQYDSVSPIGIGGLNGYAYALGNPVSNIDPTGHFAEAIHSGMRQWAARGKLRAMFNKAAEANIYIDQMAQRLGKAHGASWLPAPQKTWERAWEKTQTKYAGNPQRLKDIARNTLVAKKRRVPEILNAIESMGGSYKHISAASDPLGYSGINAVIPTPNGLWGEIQIIQKRMAYAKFSPEISPTSMSDRSFKRIDGHATSLGLTGGIGHKYYRVWRDKASSIRDKENAARLSKAYYGAILNN